MLRMYVIETMEKPRNGVFELRQARVSEFRRQMLARRVFGVSRCSLEYSGVCMHQCGGRLMNWVFSIYSYPYPTNSDP